MRRPPSCLAVPFLCLLDKLRTVLRGSTQGVGAVSDLGPLQAGEVPVRFLVELALS